MSRPDQLLLIAWLYGVGITIAVVESASVQSRPAVVGAAALLVTAASVHYANEYADVETDRLTEQTRFSGGSGVLAAGTLSRSVAWTATVVTGVVGIALALGGVAVGLVPWSALALLLAIAVLGWAYSLGPALARRGVGELDNTILGGILLPLYGAAIVDGASVQVALAVVPFTLLIVPNLLATHWADREADAAVGKRTLAVRLSRRQLQFTHALFSAAFPVAVLALWDWVLPTLVVVASLPVLPISAVAVYWFTRRHSPAPSVIAMVACAVLQGFAWLWLAVGG